ncbi:MAG: hypothetical protein R3Y38_00310 [Rikenellaceae bacterium]
MESTSKIYRSGKAPLSYKIFLILGILAALAIVASYIATGVFPLHYIAGYVILLCIIISVRAQARNFVVVDDKYLIISDKDDFSKSETRYALENITEVELGRKKILELAAYTIVVSSKEQKTLTKIELTGLQREQIDQLIKDLNALGINAFYKAK